MPLRNSGTNRQLAKQDYEDSLSTAIGAPGIRVSAVGERGHERRSWQRPFRYPVWRSAAVARLHCRMRTRAPSNWQCSALAEAIIAVLAPLSSRPLSGLSHAI